MRILVHSVTHLNLIVAPATFCRLVDNGWLW